MRKRAAIHTVIAGLLVSLLSAVQVFAQETQTPSRIRVGTYENPPKVFTSGSGQVIGLFPDLLEYIANEEGWTLTYVPGTWAECLARLEEGEPALGRVS